jgi:hypothetical protein
MKRRHGFSLALTTHSLCFSLTRTTHSLCARAAQVSFCRKAEPSAGELNAGVPKKETKKGAWMSHLVQAMSRLTSNAILDRSAAADLFRNTLLRIPTVFQRLAYLASLRDPDSGIYSHHGLVSLYGQTETRKALSQSHKGAFQDWLNLSLAEKTEDVRRYLRGLDDRVARVPEHWREAALHGRFLPDDVREGEKAFFLHEFEILLEILTESFENGRFSIYAE